MKLTELTLENAEAYYKEHRGYVVFEKRDFIIKNFSKEEILKWNEEYVKSDIIEYKKNNVKYTDIINVCNRIWKLSLIIRKYVKSKDIYIEEIELIKDLYNKYGYFMNYFMFGNDDLMVMIGMFVYYWDFIIEKNNYTNPINPGFYNNKRKRCGLVPNLLDLGYYDILDDYLENCFLPICLHYNEKNHLMDGELSYWYENNDILEAHNITDTIKLLREVNYKLPEKLDEFWRNRGL